ncbi:hypothetical protein [Sphingomonas sp.]|uniref:hypothetical protein n=1 Tax=Sphingomonas sp. TaxID=28214 RepID=UPI002DD66E03|nr:hypothetical protein [Sphingomonas sp.]
MQALLLAIIASPATAQTAPQPVCGPSAQEVQARKRLPSLKLGDQPPAAEIKTVLRHDRNGCLDPLVTRHGIGANPEKAQLLSRSPRMIPRLFIR